MKTIRTSPWAAYKTWVNTHPKIVIGLVVGMVVLAIAGVAGVWFWPASQSQAQPLPQVELVLNAEKPKKFYSPLTGVEVPDEATQKRQVTAIMIENSPDSRPQSGLKDAGIAFEAIAEGGITRFLTLFQEARPGLIGPVRSVRPYYIDWLASFDAAVAHIGGSANALKEVRNGQYKDIDQFFNAGAYWRATDRYAPHNVYTNFDKLDALNQAKGFTSSTFTPWPRKFESPQPATAAKIDIDVSSATFDVHYDYDPGTNSYVRSFGTGQKHTDREAGQIMPKTVVVIKVPTSRGFEDGYREQMDTLGTGQAFVFQDGTATQGFWHKPDKKTQIRFYDTLGRPIAFNAGQTWITVTAPEKEVKW